MAKVTAMLLLKQTPDMAHGLGWGWHWLLLTKPKQL